MLLFTAFYVSALFIFLIKIAGSPSGRKRLDPAGRSPISRKSGQHFHLHDPGAIALIFFANHILNRISRGSLSLILAENRSSGMANIRHMTFLDALAGPGRNAFARHAIKGFFSGTSILFWPVRRLEFSPPYAISDFTSHRTGTPPRRKQQSGALRFNRHPSCGLLRTGKQAGWQSKGILAEADD